jgi:hypothetical protein
MSGGILSTGRQLAHVDGTREHEAGEADRGADLERARAARRELSDEIGFVARVA